MTRNDLTTTGLTRRQTLLAVLSATGLSACGGGGDDLASVGGGGTGSFSAGPITGFGSIIVNGIRYDDSSSSISITSDDNPFRREDLRLGMVVAVQGTPAVGGRSSATRIVLGGELVGPIGSKGVNSLVVLGQTVTISAGTVFASGSLATLIAGDVVEVHGMADPANNSINATYVEKKGAVSEYRIQGRVGSADPIAKTFSIGTLQLNYDRTDPARVRVSPAVGSLVRVRLGTTAVGGAYPVVRIRKPEDSFSGFSGEVELKGSITAFTSLSSFSVNDVPVSVLNLNSTFPQGTGRIEAGAYVEVKGSLVNGVVVATRVKLEDGAPPGGAASEFELHGTISSVTTSGSGGSFTLTSSGGVFAVDWSSSVNIPNGPSTNDNGRRVEVKGTLSNGNQVTATRIKFES